MFINNNKLKKLKAYTINLESWMMQVIKVLQKLKESSSSTTQLKYNESEIDDQN